MKRYIKENYKFIIVLIFILTLFSIRFPYYIDAPGGITNMNEKIEINGYESKGSFNLAYVKEYRATIPTLLISLINKDWKVIKEEDVLLDTENSNDYQLRDKILMNESISNAIYNSYKKANKNIEILSKELLVTYITEKSNTDLKVGDNIISINNETVNSKEDITNIIQKYNINDKLNIRVINNGKEYDRYAKIFEEEDNKIIGIVVSEINEYKTNPEVQVNVDKNESGSSGGLITALSIYDSLVEEDITNNLTIVGTGTIDKDGNIGSIGGVEYKLKSSVKENADLLIVPNGKNYEDAIKLKEENNYNIDIIGVSTLEEAIEYLEKLG